MIDPCVPSGACLQGARRWSGTNCMNREAVWPLLCTCRSMYFAPLEYTSNYQILCLLSSHSLIDGRYGVLFLTKSILYSLQLLCGVQLIDLSADDQLVLLSGSSYNDS